MRLPKPLSRADKHAYKNRYGHVLVVAGSPRMLGASVLTSSAAMRSGAGLVTAAVAKDLNLTLQRKLPPTVMTWPLPQTPAGTISSRAWSVIQPELNRYQSLAVGPGLTTNTSTVGLVRKIAGSCPFPCVFDADALNGLAGDLAILKKAKVCHVLTPHPGEMARLLKVKEIGSGKERETGAVRFAKDYGCVLVLKGHQTLVASPGGKLYRNPTGNPGMATAGSGDVLTGVIAALLAQGIDTFEAACFGVYWHGLAGDRAARAHTRAAMVATDIIDTLPVALKALSRSTKKLYTCAR